MMTRFRLATSLRLPIVPLLFATLVACGADPQGEETNIGDARSWARGPMLATTLVLTSSTDTLLSYISDMAIDSRGRVYVADGQTASVIVLSPSLAYDRMIGKRGEGPGEFQNVWSLQILPDDSLLVYDATVDRITVFAPGDSSHAAYTQDFRTTGISFSNMQRLPGRGDYVGRTSRAYYADGRNEDSLRVDVLRHLSWNDEVAMADSLFSFPSNEALVRRRGNSRGQAVSVAGHPFGRRSFTDVLDGDRVVYATSLALEITVVNVRDRIQKAFEYDTAPLPVTRQELRAAERRLRNFAGVLREGAPYTWPPITGMFVDNNERIWVGIRKIDRAILEWAAFDSTGEHWASVRLPSGFRPYAIRDDRIIGAGRDDLGVPYIQIYRLDSAAMNTIQLRPTDADGLVK